MFFDCQSREDFRVTEPIRAGIVMASFALCWCLSAVKKFFTMFNNRRFKCQICKNHFFLTTKCKHSCFHGIELIFRCYTEVNTWYTIQSQCRMLCYSRASKTSSIIICTTAVTSPSYCFNKRESSCENTFICWFR